MALSRCLGSRSCRLPRLVLLFICDRNVSVAETRSRSSDVSANSDTIGIDRGKKYTQIRMRFIRLEFEAKHFLILDLKDLDDFFSRIGISNHLFHDAEFDNNFDSYSDQISPKWSSSLN